MSRQSSFKDHKRPYFPAEFKLVEPRFPTGIVTLSVNRPGGNEAEAAIHVCFWKVGLDERGQIVLTITPDERMIQLLADHCTDLPQMRYYLAHVFRAIGQHPDFNARTMSGVLEGIDVVEIAYDERWFDTGPTGWASVVNPEGRSILTANIQALLNKEFKLDCPQWKAHAKADELGQRFVRLERNTSHARLRFLCMSENLPVGIMGTPEKLKEFLGEATALVARPTPPPLRMVKETWAGLIDVTDRTKPGN